MVTSFRSAAPEEGEPPNLPVRFLLVEPDPADARLLGAALAKERFAVETAASLAEARERVRRTTFDLVLSADPLPDGSPLELLGRVPATPAVPLVLLTESASADAAKAAFAAGALDTFVKDGALLPLLSLRVERLLQLLADRRILSDLFDENARLAQANALLRELATRDALTGILDERGFSDAVKCETARAGRTGTAVTVAFFDLDRFRSVNDTRGREAGDALLRSVGALLRREAREGDLLGRLDGDAFAVLLPATPLSGALKFAERLRGKVESHSIPWRDERLTTTLSGGVGLLVDAPESPASLVGYAREQLRELKAGGRNRVGLLG